MFKIVSNNGCTFATATIPHMDKEAFKYFFEDHQNRSFEKMSLY